MAVDLILPTAAVVALAIAIFCYGCYRVALPRPLSGIPCNEKSAKRLMGDAPDLFKHMAEHGDAHSYFAKLAVEMNEPIFQAFMQPLSRPWVIVMDPRETTDIMTRRTKDFDRSNFFGQVFSSMLPNAHVHMPTGDEWHAHRRLVSDSMSPTFLNQVAAPQMWNCMMKLVELWKEKARLAAGCPFSGYNDVHNTTLDIIWTATFGGSIGPNTARTDRMAKIDELQTNADMNEPVVFPEPEDPSAFKSIITLVESMSLPINSTMPKLAHWLALNTRRSLINARRNKDELIRSKLKEARTKFLAMVDDDFESAAGLKSALDLVVSKELKMAKKEGRQADLDSPTIRDELFLFLIAGGDTTSTTLCWTVKYLTAHQDTQTKLRGILRSSFKRAYEAREMPALEEITSTSVPYVEAVIEECLRISGIIPASVRKALRDTEVLGRHIPAGTDVFMFNNGPGYVMNPIPVEEHRRSSTSQANKDKIPAWKDDPSKFLPERWLTADGAFNPNAGPLAMFGAGPRGCFGRKWAHIELRIMLILIIWNFELQPTPAGLSSFRAFDGITHGPQMCYIRLKALS